MSTMNPALGATRRMALGAGAISIASATLGGKAVAAIQREPMHFDDPIWNRETAARLQADTNGEQVYGRCTGTVVGVRPNDSARALLNFEVFSTTRVLRQPDGSYQRMCKELILYIDPKTGEFLDEWDNPYTSERVRVVEVANDPYNWIIASTIQPPPLPGTMIAPKAVDTGKPYLLKWTDWSPDTVVLTEDFHGYFPNKLDPAHWPRESSGDKAQTSELFRYFIRKADIEDLSKTHLTHNGVWVRITPWLPWMLMGQAPGHMMYDGIFRPSKTLDHFPPPVIARVKAKYPQYLEAPTKWYGPNYSSLEHYALEQKPAPAK